MSSPYQPYPQGQPGGYQPPQGGSMPSPQGYLHGAPVGNPLQAISQAFQHIFTYNGRASRSAFWWFMLFNAILNGIFRVLPANPAISIVTGIISIVLFLTVLALGARRLHDSDRSAFWLFLYLFIFIGWIWLIVYYCLPGTEGLNKYDQQV